jgi:hypothetical protein
VKLAAITLLCFGLPAAAQTYEGARSRTLQGIVRHADGEPVRGAAVELENTKTLEIRSFVTQKDGKYHFEDLYNDIDYTIRVEYHGAFSHAKTLSQFSSRKSVTIDFTLNQAP